MYVKDRDLYTPLHAAAASGNVECAHILINSGTDIEAKNVYGNTPLHIACLNGSAHVIKELIANNVNLGKSLYRIVTQFYYQFIYLQIIKYCTCYNHNRSCKLSWTDRTAHCLSQYVRRSVFRDAYTKWVESKCAVGRWSYAITHDCDTWKIYAI